MHPDLDEMYKIIVAITLLSLCTAIVLLELNIVGTSVFDGLSSVMDTIDTVSFEISVTVMVILAVLAAVLSYKIIRYK